MERGVEYLIEEAKISHHTSTELTFLLKVTLIKTILLLSLFLIRMVLVFRSKKTE